MKYSLKIATIKGIQIKVHVTFWLLPVFLAFAFGTSGSGFNFAAAAGGFVFTFALFVCVVLHELGHSFAAVFFGGKVRDIVLLPVGGMARIERMPSGAPYEIIMAVAGPMVNVVILLVLLVAIIASHLIFGWRIDLEKFISMRTFREDGFISV